MQLSQTSQNLTFLILCRAEHEQSHTRNYQYTPRDIIPCRLFLKHQEGQQWNPQKACGFDHGNIFELQIA